MSAATAVTNYPTPNARREAAPRVVMIAGFFGAGKTTALERFAEFAEKRGLQVSAENSADVILAEASGQGVDVMATAKAADHNVAPLSVVVDPTRAARFFKIEPGNGFSDKVSYIYRKQLEEADLIVINKADVAAGGTLAALRDRMGREFPGARIFEVSARTGIGLEKWFEAILGDTVATRPKLEWDRQLYGEALGSLGCVHCRVQTSALKGFVCNPIMRELGQTIQRDLRAARMEIAHLKMSVTPAYDVGGVATFSLVRSDAEPDLGEELPEPIERGNLSLRLQAEGKPDALHSTVTNALTHLCAVFPGLFARVIEMEHFRPTQAAATGESQRLGPA